MDAYASGATLRELAARYGISFQRIAIRLRGAGVVLRPRHKRPAQPHPCAVDGCPNMVADPRQRFCSLACAGASRRRPMCRHGHPLIPENLYPRYGKTPPRCKRCGRRRLAEWKARKKAETSQ